MSVPSKESIYNLIPKQPPVRIRPPRHTSKFHHKAKEESRVNKAPGKTMGPAKVPLNSPQSYLKKRSKEPKLPERMPFKYPGTDGRKPAVPSHTEKPQMGAKSSRDFVTTNAVNTITSVPRKAQPKYVDTATGCTHDLEDSGLVPKYIQKKGYGSVPSYLKERQREMAEAQQQYEAYIEESMRSGQMAQVESYEREALLEGLKKNWEELHHQYQGLSVVTDTAPKKARKERMEAEMKQLERDIELVERHRVIYVAQEQPFHYVH